MNIDMVRGDTLSIAFSIEADTVIDIDSDNVAFTFSVKKKAADTEYVFQKDKSAVTVESDNSFILRIAPEDTAELDEGIYEYDLEFRYGSDVYTLSRGRFCIISDITV